MSRWIECGAIIRKLRPDEQQAYRDFLMGLDRQSRRDRFCGAVSDSFLAEHAERTFAAQTLVHGVFVDGSLRGVADLTDEAPGAVAEAAFAVDPALRNQGIGTALLDVTMLAARNRDYRAVHVMCLRSNFAMRRLAQKAEAELTLTFDEIHGEMVPPKATMLSRFREGMVDAYDRAAWLMRLPPPAVASPRPS